VRAHLQRARLQRQSRQQAAPSQEGSPRPPAVADSRRRVTMKRPAAAATSSTDLALGQAASVKRARANSKASQAQGASGPGPDSGSGSCGGKPARLFVWHPGRLHWFHTWLRHKAHPAWRRVHLAAEVERSRRLLRIEGERSMRIWLAALVAFWWLDSCARDTVVNTLAFRETPNWEYVRGLLVDASLVARTCPPRRIDGPTGAGRRGPGALLSPESPKTSKIDRTLITIKTWHSSIVSGTAAAVAAVADRLEPDAEPPGPPTSTEVASALRTLPGCGPYLAKNVINTLLLMNLVRFDGGVLGPGAIRALAYLQGHDVTNDTGQSKGLWPDQADPSGWRAAVQELADQEVHCHWVDMQCALCYWAPWRRGPRRAAVTACPPMPELSGPEQPGGCVGVATTPRADKSNRGADS